MRLQSYPSRWRSGPRLAAAVAAVSVAIGAVSAIVTPVAAIASVASPCVPYQVPGMPGDGRGELMTMNDSGVYVGRVRDGSGPGFAAWWTHAGSDLSTGWTLHAPNIPATGAEFLDVNASGVMSGFSVALEKGFVYDSNTGDFTWLPDFAAGYNSYARRINASGVVTGNAIDTAGDFYAATWTPPYTTAQRVHAPGENRNITDPDGTHYKAGSVTNGINDLGTVAGAILSHGTAQLVRGFTETASGEVTLLPAGYDQAFGFAINNAGLVVGASTRDANGALVPAYWRNGVEHDMGAPGDAADGTAYGISQGGWAAGGIDLPDTKRSFVWTGAGTMQLNEPLPGFNGSWSHGVSDTLGQIAGSSIRSDGSNTPTIWQCPAGFTTG
jgi:hypothetical protein